MAKMSFERRVRAAVGTWTAAGEIRHVVKEERPASRQENREISERQKLKRKKDDEEATERLAKTVATAFDMSGKRQQTRESAFPKLEARKAMLKAGRGKIEWHIRTIHGEIEFYSESRPHKRTPHDRVDEIVRKIVERQHMSEHKEPEDLWATWDRGL